MNTTTNPRPTFSADPNNHGARCWGANHTDNATLGTCDSCGREVARRDGSRTLHPVTIRRMARTYACWDVHTCTPEAVALYAAVKAEKLAEGQIIKGARVIVARGRKVAKGTEGVVIWLGRDAWDNDRVGIKDDEGTAHWTALKNVDLAP